MGDHAEGVENPFIEYIQSWHKRLKDFYADFCLGRMSANKAVWLNKPSRSFVYIQYGFRTSARFSKRVFL